MERESICCQRKNNLSYQVPILEKGLKVLELIVENPSGLTLTDISEYLRLPKTTVFRILSFWEHKRYISRSNDSTTYHITQKLLFLGLMNKEQDLSKEDWS